MSSRWSKENAQEITLNHPVEYMRFTLIYDGPLHASGGDTADKHKIRKQLHGQLMDVWYNHPTVAGQYERWLKEPEKEREALATLHAGQNI